MTDKTEFQKLLVENPFYRKAYDIGFRDCKEDIQKKIDKGIEEMKALADPENTILGFEEKMGLMTAMNILVRNIGE